MSSKSPSILICLEIERQDLNLAKPIISIPAKKELAKNSKHLLEQALKDAKQQEIPSVDKHSSKGCSSEIHDQRPSTIEKVKRHKAAMMRKSKYH
jgi:hypothetical protein